MTNREMVGIRGKKEVIRKEDISFRLEERGERDRRINERSSRQATKRKNRLWERKLCSNKAIDKKENR